MRSIRFTHEICATDGKAFSFCGHLHPGVVLHGLGKQSLRFPCFYFTKDHCILPAFSRFTGTAQVDAKKAASVYAIVDQALVKL
jgi:metallophosphoesterase superfamily enzyme